MCGAIGTSTSVRVKIRIIYPKTAIFAGFPLEHQLLLI